MELRQYVLEQLGTKTDKVSSTNMEVMICLAHNAKIIGDSPEKLKENLYYVCGGKPTSTQLNLDQEYLMNREKYDSMVECLSGISSKLRKLPNRGCVISSSWKGEDNTPKTDIISEDGKFRISLKNRDTGAQLCSAKFNEAYSTLMVGFDMLSEEDQAYLLKILEADSWSSYNNLPMYVTDIMKSTDTSLDEWKAILSDTKKVNSNKQAALRNLMKKNPEYAHAVLREAATGTMKFGAGSNAEANYMMCWSEKNPSKSELLDADAYIDDHISRNMFNYDVNFKSSRNGKNVTAYASLRISIKKD